jgi:hypothetical protein
MHARLDVPFELPQWVFRAKADVNGQVNFFDNMVTMALPRSTFSIVHSGVQVLGRVGHATITPCAIQSALGADAVCPVEPECPNSRIGECKMIDTTACPNPKCSDVATQTDQVLVIEEPKPSVGWTTAEFAKFEKDQEEDEANGCRRSGDCTCERCEPDSEFNQFKKDNCRCHACQ